MKTEQLGEYSSIAVSVMRRGGMFGNTSEQLVDGNTISRLCSAAGEGACLKVCQINEVAEYEPKLCAEENISHIADEFGVNLDGLVIAAATQDNVVFGDNINLTSLIPEYGEYQKVPEANAFFFRPFIDKTLSNEPMRALAMRMADCGSVMFEFKDNKGSLVLGQAHFSRTNMRGPTEYKEEHILNGQKVSWAEYVLGTAIDYYGAKPEDIKINLIAAVERDDFIHHYKTIEEMRNHYPGWEELGFMHPEEGKAEDFDCEIDYRKMIEWQLAQATISLGLNPENIITDDAINTGDLSLGHASHHWASKEEIAHGRDMYVIGVNELDYRIHEIEREIASAWELSYEYLGSAQFEYSQDERERALNLQDLIWKLKKQKIE